MNKFLIGLILLVIMIALTGCGVGFETTTGPRGEQGPAGPPGSPAPTPASPVVDAVQVDIDALLKDENDYRLGLGQTMLSNGLTCSVQQILSGSKISASSPGGGAVIVTTGTQYAYLYKGLFNQPDSNGQSNLLPISLRPLFVGFNYIIRCNGFLVVRETNYYEFEVTSDDGSLLSVDGSQIITNDDNHGMVRVVGTRFLRRGVRSISLSYAQSGGGNFGLILKAGGASIDPKFYAH